MLVVCTYFICNKVNEYFLNLKEKLISHFAHFLKHYGQHRKTDRQKDDGQGWSEIFTCPSSSDMLRNKNNFHTCNTITELHLSRTSAVKVVGGEWAEFTVQ